STRSPRCRWRASASRRIGSSGIGRSRNARSSCWRSAVPSPAAPDPSATPLPPPAAHVMVERLRGGQWQQRADHLAEEVPVALLYNGIPLAVMLCTPRDLEDFALGFSLSEGIVDEAADLERIEIRTQDAGIEIRLQIAEWRAA